MATHMKPCPGAGVGPQKGRWLQILQEGTARYLPISKNLEEALKGMHYQTRERHLWVDAVCINQSKIEERNEQVPMMDQIYGKAHEVCVYLGKETPTTRTAFAFIEQMVSDGSLINFDKFVGERSEVKDKQWTALKDLMTVPWFFRRWVIQETAVAKPAKIYCGNSTVTWQEFKHAVSLFVKTYSGEDQFSAGTGQSIVHDNIPNIFGEIQCPGAARLVDVTSSLFRPGPPGQHGAREPLSSLEYLITTLTNFEASQPRDTIYALLAITKDTKPIVDQRVDVKYEQHRAFRSLKQWAHQKFKLRYYNVDYDEPISDVFVDFIEFAIRKADPNRALDILCRPWVPAYREEDEKFGMRSAAATQDFDEVDQPQSPQSPQQANRYFAKAKRKSIQLPSWTKDKSVVNFPLRQHKNRGPTMERPNADLLVGEVNQHGQRSYGAAGATVLDAKKMIFDRSGDSHYSLFVEEFEIDTIKKIYPASQLGGIPPQWAAPAGWTDLNEPPPDQFWRLLVGDRGPDGRNPPPYFEFASSAVLQELWTSKNPLDTSELINYQNSSPINQFAKRIQAVIWNGAMSKTKFQRIGLVSGEVRKNDRICILNGCSVPVVLRRFEIQRDEKERWHQEYYARMSPYERAKRKEAARKIKRARHRVLEVRRQKEEIRAKANLKAKNDHHSRHYRAIISRTLKSFLPLNGSNPSVQRLLLKLSFQALFGVILIGLAALMSTPAPTAIRQIDMRTWTKKAYSAIAAMNLAPYISWGYFTRISFIRRTIFHLSQLWQQHRVRGSALKSLLFISVGWWLCFEPVKSLASTADVFALDQPKVSSVLRLGLLCLFLAHVQTVLVLLWQLFRGAAKEVHARLQKKQPVPAPSYYYFPRITTTSSSASAIYIA